MRPARMGLAALLLAATSAAGIALTGTSAWLLSRAAEHPEASALTLAAVAVRALGIGRGLLRYAERLVGHDAVLRDAAVRRSALYAALRRDPQSGSGRAVSGLVHDVEGAQDVWLRGLLPAAAAALVWLVVVPVVTALLPVAGLVLAAGLGAAVFAVPALAWRAARAEEQRAAAHAAHLTAVTDVVHGAADLVALRGAEQATAGVAAAAAELGRLDLAAAQRTAVLACAAPLLQAATVVGLLLLAASAVRTGTLARVDAAVVVLAGWASFEPAAALHEAAAAVRRGRAALRRWRPASAEPEADGVRSSLATVVVATGLEVRHPGRARAAVAGVDLVLQPGRSLGVVGGSGAGKSSLLAALAGTLAPSRGTVCVDGRSVADLGERDRAASIVLAEQTAHVFDASVRDNLRLADPDASDDRLREVLDVVGLGPWVDALPEGMATRLGHRGARLSGGQRRRLTVARALLSPAPFLLLDEPTEGLAPEEADALVTRLLAHAPHRSVVVVTHRPAVWGRLDELLVLEHGRVTAQGSPQEVADRSALVAEALDLAGLRGERRMTFVPFDEDQRTWAGLVGTENLSR